MHSTDESRTLRWHFSHSRAVQPNAVQPNAVQPNAEQPNAEQPNAEQPNAEQPNAEQLNAEQLNAEQRRVGGRTTQSSAGERSGLEMLSSRCRRVTSFLALAVIVSTICESGELIAQEQSESNLATDAREFFDSEVRPILSRSCVNCHSGSSAESGLKLNELASLLKGGDSETPAIARGNPAASELIIRVEATDDSRMPPEGKSLSPREVSVLKQWIRSGAAMPERFEFRAEDTGHWAFQALQAEVPVDAANTEWTRNPIDAFIQRKLQAAGLDPSTRADRRTLIRRLYLDVTGIPPSPDEVSAFESDNGVDAYERLVDRVLSDSHYGERWARHWLDLARFGETHGFETNRERKNAWPYRDYVIRAINEDLPYDQFVRDQLAGDVLGDATGTSFLVAGPYDLVKSPDINLTLMQRQDELADMINTSGTVFLGLTMGCARCHDHKFDPITQRDYYSLQAIFAGVKHGDRKLPLSPAQQGEIQRLRNRKQELRHLLVPLIRAPEGRFLVLDDSQIADPFERGFHPLATVAGQGKNPAGRGRGERDDEGNHHRAGNLSSGQYSWFKNVPGEPVASYRPLTKGTYRIWLSWGADHETHSTDAKYVIDQDGDPKTTADWQELAIVNQQLFADRTGEISNRSLWSGFLDAGVHEFQPASEILLVGGTTGPSVTADVILLEAEPDSGQSTTVLQLPRKPVNSIRNEDLFEPIRCRSLRFTILKTNRSQPCIDELEVWSQDTNVALASSGTVPSASSVLPGYEIHQLKHINDGKYNNERSWISNEPGGWVELKFPNEVTIDRVVWGRDRSGRFTDRVPIEYEISIEDGSGKRHRIGSHEGRLDSKTREPVPVTYELTGASGATIKAQLAELESLRARIDRLSVAPTVYLGVFEQPGPTHLLYRGEPTAKREVVQPGTVGSLGDLALTDASSESQRRSQLAEWMVSDASHLSSRVIVNRLWMHHFGTGIVDTPSDLGRNGAAPTHPELLDWLAHQLITNDWSIKHVQRLILTSATFQQSSQWTENGLKTDAACRLLWRYPSRRLEAEAIRDVMVTATGVMQRTMYGPGFDGFEVQMENVRHYFPKTQFGDSDWRRMIYMTKVRQEQDSVFGAFDCPDASQSVPKRSSSTTPLQALNLFNSAFTIKVAQLLSARVRQDCPDDLDGQIQAVFRHTLLRNPTPSEREGARQLADEFGITACCRAILNSNEFLFIP